MRAGRVLVGLLAASLVAGQQSSTSPPSSTVLVVTSASTAVTAPAVTAPKTAPLTLRSIFSSHGIMTPKAVQAGIYKYTFTLDQPTGAVAMVPELDRTGLDLQSLSEQDVPKVFVTWPGMDDREAEASGLALKKQITLPQDGSDLPVTIRVVSTQDASSSLTYKVTYKQKYLPPAALVGIEGTDDTGRSVLVDPVMTEDQTSYKVFVSPAATNVKFRLQCNKKSTLRVNGRSASNNSDIPIKRELFHHTQIVEVSCARPSEFPGIPVERKYALMVISDYPFDDLVPPPLIVDETGRECNFLEEDQKYECPDPQTDNHKIRMVSHNNQDIKYVVHTPNNNVEVRLADMQLSIPFTYSNKLLLTAYAGQQSRSWPISFGGTPLPSLLSLLGWILAIALGFLLFALLLVVGLSSIFGLGVPLGATEIAATMTFIIQYLCFANFMRQGSPILNDMISPLKWVTLFWPLPFEAGDNLRRRQLLGVTEYAGAYGLSLWGDSSLGDVTDIRNACGCIFWSEMVLLFFVLLHVVVWIKFHVFEKSYTCPHRIALGNWESRCLHWLAFPTSAGAAMILASDITTTLWKVLAGITLAFYFCWIIFVFVEVYTAVSGKSVSWIWNSSLREDGTLEDESGYWSDVVSDQLLTQPVNRSLCRGFFPFRWISTVADILPVSLAQSVFNKGNESLFPPAQFNDANHNEPAYSLAKNPQVVEVIKGRAPGGPCNGQRLISGLLRTQWLDILFTYQALTTFHSQVNSEAGQFSIPLIVKTSQLSGPLTSGRHAFFYDGARVPFIRIADFIYRILVGIFIGVALASEGPHPDTAMFCCISLLSLALLAYVAVLRPYSRMKENWMFVGLLATVTFSAASFVFYGFAKQDPSWIADIFLWVVAICCFILAAYSCVVTFSVFTALFCPPLEETRFLEKLANCSLTISNASNAWNIEIPAYSKYPVRDIEARCTQTGNKRLHVTMQGTRNEPSLEFSSQAIRAACRSGFIAVPVATLFVASGQTKLGYRHCSISSRDALAEEVINFLVEDQTAGFNQFTASEVAKHVSHQVSTKSKGRAILCITIIPPRG